MTIYRCSSSFAVSFLTRIVKCCEPLERASSICSLAVVVYFSCMFSYILASFSLLLLAAGSILWYFICFSLYAVVIDPLEKRLRQLYTVLSCVSCLVLACVSCLVLSCLVLCPFVQEK